jgi:hypothetical protein
LPSVGRPAEENATEKVICDPGAALKYAQNFSFAFSIVKAIVVLIRRSQIQVDTEEQERKVVNIKNFLYVYYHFWAEADGHKFVEGQVLNAEARVLDCESAVRDAKSRVEEVPSKLRESETRQMEYDAECGALVALLSNIGV